MSDIAIQRIGLGAGLTRTVRRPGWLSAAIPFLLMGGFLGSALALSLPAMDGVRWLGDADFRRDAGIAQSIRDGYPLADPAYRDLPFWFSPLLPAVVALISKLSGSPVNLVYSQIVPWLNLLAPISFAALVAHFGGRWTALASLAGYLFLVTRDTPGWASATYSPIPYAENFVQAVFFLLLAAYGMAVRREQLGWYALAGLLFGIVIGGRIAPTILFLAILIGDTVRRIAANPVARLTILSQIAVLVGIAAIVSSPYLVSLLVYYRLAVVNESASRWLGEMTAIEAADVLLFRVLGPLTLVALVGFGVVYRRRQTGTAPLLIWAIVSVGTVLYAELWQAVEPLGIHLSAFVPPHHFLFYLKAAESALFGFGALALAEWLSRAVRARASTINERRTTNDPDRPAAAPPSEPGTQVSGVTGPGSATIDGKPVFAADRIAKGILVAGLVFATLLLLPTVRGREDFHRPPEIAIEEQMIIEWLRDNTQPTDVVLTSSREALMLVAPSGRKVVTLPKLFSNPFVAWEPRDADRARLVDALLAGDRAAFLPAARAHGVAWVLWPADAPLPTGMTGTWDRAFTAGGTTILRLRPT